MTRIFADGRRAWLARPAMLAAVLGLMTALPASAAEFDDSCAMGLASGQMAKTDCSVNWTDTDGKVYCFSAEASKEAFLKNPEENLEEGARVPRRQAGRSRRGQKGFRRGRTSTPASQR